MTDALNDALRALALARTELATLPPQEARTALIKLHEAMWYIDEDLRHRTGNSTSNKP